MLQTDSIMIVDIAAILKSCEQKIQKVFGNNVIVKLDVRFISDKPLAVPEKRIIVNKVISIVADTYGLKKELLTSDSRIRNVVEARSICYFLLRYFLHDRISLKDLGQIFKQDHSTVINALRNAENWYKLYDTYKDKVDNIIETIINEK